MPDPLRMLSLSPICCVLCQLLYSGCEWKALGGNKKPLRKKINCRVSKFLFLFPVLLSPLSFSCFCLCYCYTASIDYPQRTQLNETPCKGSIFFTDNSSIILVTSVSKANKQADKTFFVVIFFRWILVTKEIQSYTQIRLYLHSLQNFLKSRNI